MATTTQPDKKPAPKKPVTNTPKPSDPKKPDPKRGGNPIGPTSIEGVEAGDLPDGGRGSVNTDPGREGNRHLTSHTGEVVGSELNTDVGLTGTPGARQADQQSNQPKRHQGNS